MILVITDVELQNLAAELGNPVVDINADHLWDFAYGLHTTGLVYMKDLTHPHNVADPWRIHDEVLLVKTLSLMSDMWDIPLVVVVWGGPRIMPTNSNGVWWATLEEAVHSREHYVIRTNGLFGPNVPNDVLAALLSEKPTFDRSWHISPLWEGDLLFEIDWYMDYDNRDDPRPPNEQGPMHTFLGSSPGAKPASWYDIASGIIVGARPWESNRNPSLERYKREVAPLAQKQKRYQAPRAYGHLNTVKWDASWQTPKHDAAIAPVAEAFKIPHVNSWQSNFARMAKDHQHDLVNGVEDLLFA